jgi:HTH-type transcriptional regulator/antitoxin HipB
MDDAHADAIDFGDPDTVGRLVARARRVADLSQRDLAQRVGVSQAGISRLESGRGLPSLGLLNVILRASGLRLLVVDQDGSSLGPIPASTVRDHAERRFPAHLDVEPPDLVPTQVRDNPRYDRQPPRAWFHHRRERDRLAGLRPESTRQQDHPTTGDLELRLRLRRGPQPTVRPLPLVIECTCADACYDDDVIVGCLPDCDCQCEPPPTAISLS